MLQTTAVVLLAMFWAFLYLLDSFIKVTSTSATLFYGTIAVYRTNPLQFFFFFFSDNAHSSELSNVVHVVQSRWTV